MTKRRRKGNKKRGTRKLFKFIKNRRQRMKKRGRKFRRTFRKRRKQLNLRFRSLRRGGGGGKKRRRRPSKKKKKKKKTKKKYGPSPRPASPVAAAAAAKKAQKTADKKKIIADKAVEKAAASKTTADQKQKLANDAKTKLQEKSSSSKKPPSLKKAVSKVQVMQKVANTKKVKAATDAKKAEQAKKEAEIAKQKAATTAAKLLSAKAKAKTKAQTRKKGKMVASAAAAAARSRKNKTRKKEPAATYEDLIQMRRDGALTETEFQQAKMQLSGRPPMHRAPPVAAKKAAFRAKQAKKKGATAKPAAPAPKKTAAPKPAAPAPKKTAAKSPKPQCKPFIIATTPCKTLKKQYHNASRKGCHPDKGGSDIDFQTLKENYDAQDKWCNTVGNAPRPKVLGRDQWNCSKKPGYPDTWDKAKKKCNPKKAATSAKERPRAQPAARAPRQPAPTASKPQQQTKSGEGGLGGSSLSAPVMKGTTKLPVRDSDVFHKGDVIRIGARGASEVRSVIGHGSIILNSPLTGNYPKDTPVTIIEHAHAPLPTPAEKAQKEATEKAHKEALEKARKEGKEKARKEAEDKVQKEAAKKKKQGEKCGDNADCASNVCSITLRTCSTEEAERALQKKEETQITTLTKQLKQRATPKSGAAAKIELSPAAKKEVQEKFASPPDSKGNRIVILKITGEQIGPSGSEGTVVRVNSGLSAPNSVAATGTAVKEGMDK